MTNEDKFCAETFIREGAAPEIMQLARLILVLSDDIEALRKELVVERTRVSALKDWMHSSAASGRGGT